MVSLKHIGLVITLCLFWFMSEHVLASSSVSSINSDQENKVTSYSSIWLKDESGKHYEVDPSSLKTHVDIKVSGPILRATVTQEFKNPSQVWLEGVYTYPLPENAAVDQMRMRVGDRIIEGQIKEKEQAKKQYEKAKQEGKRASLVSNARTNQFTTRVANIAPNAKVRVEFEYQQMLQFDDQSYSFRFPMTLTEQYTPPQTFKEPLFTAPENHIKSVGEANDNPVEISVTVNAGFPIQSMTSASHTVDFQRQGDEAFSAYLKGDALESNRDFQLSWAIKSTSEPMVSLLRETRSDGEYGFLMIMPPDMNEQDQNQAMQQNRELMLVLDVSGSMQGASIRQAQEALAKAIEAIDPETRFNLILFNQKAKQMFRKSVKASTENKRFALAYVDNIRADGGTEMAPAIKLALADSQRSARSNGSELPLFRQVVFITDGAVGNEQELFDLIQAKLGTSRLFTVGIGSAPNSYFMRKAARAGRGTFTYIGSPNEVVSKMDALFKKLAAPAMIDIRFELPGTVAETLPNPLPDLYVSEPVYVSFKADSFPDSAQLTATLAGMPSYLELPMGSPKQSKGVAVEWARLKIDSLAELHRERSGEDQGLVKNELIDVAIQYHQVTQFTSMLAVDVTPVRSGGLLDQKRFKSNLPKGWGGKDSGVRLAQTASSAPLHLFIGLAMLMLAFVITMTRRNSYAFVKH
jgi:Ca-activated chloride channel family protein